MYLLPAIDILEGKAVRLKKGDYDKATVYNHNPVAQAQIFEEAGAEWLHVVDLDGARLGEPKNLDIVEKILAKTLLKVEFGGGIRSMEIVERLYESGVSRIVLGTGLVSDPLFAQEAIARYGGAVAAGIDARDGEVAVAGWREGAGVAAQDLIAEVAGVGFTHLIYTDIARDGMQTGIDPAAYLSIAKTFGNPVIASGGVASIDDIERLGAIALSIEGVIAGRAIYERSLDVAEAVALCNRLTRQADALRLSADPCGGCSC